MEQKNLTEDAIKESIALFFEADGRIKDTKLSRGSVVRALRSAMHFNLTTREVRLLSKEEKELAFVIQIMLDSRLIMQAKKLNDLNEVTNKEPKGEANVENS